MTLFKNLCTLYRKIKSPTLIMVWCKKINIPSVAQAGKTIEPLYETVGRDSSVGIGTCHRLGGPGIESQWGARFSTPIQTSPEAHPASYTMDTGSFLAVMWTRCGVDHHPHLHLYSPSGLLWPVLG
jgi:hypothetical protein